MFLKNQILAVILTSFGFLAKSQDNPQLVVTTGHHGQINTVSYSKNGRYVISGGDDKILKIYDLTLQQEFNSIAGFSDDIRVAKFSSDSKYIFVFGTNYIYTWSHPEGKLIHRSNAEDHYKGKTEDYFISPANKIYIARGSDGLIVYDPIKGQIEKHWENIQLHNIIHLSKQNLLVGKEQDENDALKYNLAVYKAETGERIKSIPINGGNTGMRFHVDKNEELLALENEGGKLTIINTKNFEIIANLNISAVGLTCMEFYPDNSKIITAGYDNKIRVTEIASQKTVNEINAEILNGKIKSNFHIAMGFYDMEFSPNGKTIAFAYHCIYDNYSAYRIGYYSPKDFTLKHVYDGQNKICLSLVTDKDENKLICGNLSNPQGIRLWNMKKGEIESYYKGSAQAQVCNDKLVMFNYNEARNNFIRLYDFSSMQLEREIKIEGTAETAMSKDGKYIAALVTNVLKTGMPELHLMLWEVSTGKEIIKKKFEIVDRPRSFCFSPTNKLLLINLTKYEIYDAATGKSIKSIELKEQSPFSLWHEFDETGKQIYFGESTDRSFEIRSMNAETGEYTTQLHDTTLAYPFMLKFNPDYSQLFVSLIDYTSDKPFAIYVYDWKTKTLIKKYNDFTAPVYQINFGTKTGNIYFGDNNGVITIVGNDFTKKGIMLAANEKDYMIISPENYYKTSITNTEGIAFRYKNELYRFDQFDLRFNRPDIVLQNLDIVSETQLVMYKDAWLKRIKRLGFDEASVTTASIHSPEISIQGKDELPFSTSAQNIKFTIHVTDSLFDLKRVNVYVNNIPIYGKTGYDLGSAGKHVFEKEIIIDLEEGKNKIAVSVMNVKGVESVRESFVTQCTYAYAKPNLYLLAVGVSKYSDSTMNLTYSDKDVNDISEAFITNNKTNQRYGNIYTKVITNQNATLAGIDEAAAFLKNSTVNDQIILFFSGHGLIDQNMDYYLATTNVDFLNPSAKGLLYTHFQDYFDGLACRKRLLLIDACHSGEFDKTDYVAQPMAMTDPGQTINEKDFKFRGKKVIGIANTNDLMKELFTDLRKETGATVIASSSGTEFSVESTTWKNGAFTYSLKEGLTNMKADGNHNKEITLSETRDYVIQKVKELTAGKQNPTTRQENIESDYRLW